MYGLFHFWLSIFNWFLHIISFFIPSPILAILSSKMSQNATDGPDYTGFVLVAENEIVISGKDSSVTTWIGDYQWSFNFVVNATGSPYVVNVACHFLNEVTMCDCLAEILTFRLSRSLGKYNYIKCDRIKFNQNKNKFSLPTDEAQSLLLIIRILENRDKFPDFTLRNEQLGTNGILQVGDTQFYVDRNNLAQISPYFYNLFTNENFSEKNQLYNELRSKDPKIFHDFLLMTSPERFDVLPNPENVGGLIEMSNSFGVDFYMKNCVRHLKLARNIPSTERIAMLRKHNKYNVEASVLRAFAEML